MSRWAFPNRARPRHFPDEISDELRVEGLVQLAIGAGDWPEYPYEVVRALIMTGYVDACAQVARGDDDGFVHRSTLRRYMSDTVIEAMARPLSDECAGILHRRGDECRCLEGRAWPPLVDFAVHDFLAANGTKREKNTKAQKRAELRNFRGAVLKRDRFMCRVCLAMPDTLADHKSDRALEVDHGDPNAAVGVDNLFTLCKRCNRHKASRSFDQALMVLHAAPAHPARSFEEALEGAEATRVELRAAPRPVVPGHDAPMSPSPSPRPPQQRDPWNRAQIPTPPPADPDPPDPIRTRSESDREPDSDPIRPGSEPGTEPGPETGSQPDTDRIADPDAAPPPDPDRSYLGREGEGEPARASPGGDGLTPGLRGLLAQLPPGVAMPVWEIAKIIGMEGRLVDQGLHRLLAHGLVDRHPSHAGQPVTWSRRHAAHSGEDP